MKWSALLKIILKPNSLLVLIVKIWFIINIKGPIPTSFVIKVSLTSCKHLLLKNTDTNFWAKYVVFILVFVISGEQVSYLLKLTNC